MLSEAHRIKKGEDYRKTVSSGYRIIAENTLIYFCFREDTKNIRFGFIVSKKIGKSFYRNKIRRRLKAIAFECIDQYPYSCDVVIRMLPKQNQSHQWQDLHREVTKSLCKGFQHMKASL